MGAVDIAFMRWQADSNGLSLRVLFRRSIHNVSLHRPDAQEARMQSQSQLAKTCEGVIADIAAILAQGYLRYRKSRRMSADVAENRPESRQSAPDMEKRT